VYQFRRDTNFYFSLVVRDDPSETLVRSCMHGTSGHLLFDFDALDALEDETDSQSTADSNDGRHSSERPGAADGQDALSFSSSTCHDEEDEIFGRQLVTVAWNVADGCADGDEAGFGDAVEQIEVIPESDAYGITVACPESSSASCRATATDRRPWTQVFTQVSKDDDEMSEVWPGDQLLDLDGSLELNVADLEHLGYQLGSAQHDGLLDANKAKPTRPATAWEVVYSRVIVRGAPSFDAPTVGLLHHHEVIFAEPDWTDLDWVKIEGEDGYILKDGRNKDPSLDMLLKPYELTEVPENFRADALEQLKQVWATARSHCARNLEVGSNLVLLQVPFIQGLRKATRDSVGDTFGWMMMDSPRSRRIAEAFTTALHFEVDRVLSAHGRPPQGGSSSSSTASPSKAADPPLGSCDSRWRHDAAPVRDADGSVSMSSASALLASMERRSLPSHEDVVAIMAQVFSIYECAPTLIEFEVPVGSTLHLVGDIHGQYWDLLHIIKTYGPPSQDNWYLFNGDFVDRGQFSTEVLIALFALKVAAPEWVHLNRGNHESAHMNVLYGFMTEATEKYSQEVFTLFCRAFKCLPLAHVVNRAVLVVHGGLSRAEGASLQDIRTLDRKKEPGEQDDLMIDLLWSDPRELPGRGPSPRGAGTLFGPDVTERFCRDNGLLCVVRSHEMKQQGFEWHHKNMCLTIFSAANYCGISGNDGAICNVTPVTGADGKASVTMSQIQLRRFSPNPHPDESRKHTRVFF